MKKIKNLWRAVVGAAVVFGLATPAIAASQKDVDFLVEAAKKTKAISRSLIGETKIKGPDGKETIKKDYLEIKALREEVDVGSHSRRIYFSVETYPGYKEIGGVHIIIDYVTKKAYGVEETRQLIISDNMYSFADGIPDRSSQDVVIKQGPRLIAWYNSEFDMDGKDKDLIGRIYDVSIAMFKAKVQDKPYNELKDKIHEIIKDLDYFKKPLTEIQRDHKDERLMNYQP